MSLKEIIMRIGSDREGRLRTPIFCIHTHTQNTILKKRGWVGEKKRESTSYDLEAESALPSLLRKVCPG